MALFPSERALVYDPDGQIALKGTAISIGGSSFGVTLVAAFGWDCRLARHFANGDGSACSSWCAIRGRRQIVGKRTIYDGKGDVFGPRQPISNKVRYVKTLSRLGEVKAAIMAVLYISTLTAFITYLAWPSRYATTDTLHTATNDNDTPAIGTRTVATAHHSTTDWHLYGLDWQADRMDFYLDREKFGAARQDFIDWFAGLEMDIRLNVAMDASWFDASNESTESASTTSMHVDYVRLYDIVPAPTR